ncbi:hypothetical protein [Vulcanisaeta thermophila]|nr:hypothetical protein [Vulcanisaeta thermophila]
MRDTNTLIFRESPKTPMRVCVIGLGRMGRGMAINLVSEGLGNG